MKSRENSYARSNPRLRRMSTLTRIQAQAQNAKTHIRRNNHDLAEECFEAIQRELNKLRGGQPHMKE